MKKILLWAAIVVVLVAITGIVGAVILFKLKPQTITLNDGTKLTLLQVTYGKKHNFVGKGPDKLQGGAFNMDSADDTLCLWVRQERKGNNWPNYQVFAYDGAETGCVGTWGGNSRETQNNRNIFIACIRFEAFPRRASKIHFRFSQWGQRGQEAAKGQWAISNPAHGPFPNWSPAPLPITQEDGDLSVTLTRFNYDVDYNSSGGRNQDKAAKSDPKNKAVRVSFRVEQNGNAVTNWQPVSFVTSDATGNRANGNGWSSSQENNEASLKYQYGLWPDEPAWKVRLEFSRSSGFNNDELWTVSDIPFKTGDLNRIWERDKSETPFAETTLNGTRLKLFPIVKPSSDQARNYGNLDAVFTIRAEPSPEGTRMTVLKVTDDRHHEVQCQDWGSGGGGDYHEYHYALRNFGGATNLNVTVALHRSRFVEFTAKPVKQ